MAWTKCAHINSCAVSQRLTPETAGVQWLARHLAADAGPQWWSPPSQAARCSWYEVILHPAWRLPSLPFLMAHKPKPLMATDSNSFFGLPCSQISWSLWTQSLSTLALSLVSHNTYCTLTIGQTYPTILGTENELLWEGHMSEAREGNYLPVGGEDVG